MKMLTLLMILMLGMLTTSNEEDNNTVTENCYVMNLDSAEKLEKMTYSSLFSKAGIIVLEDTDESLLGKVDKIEFLDNYLYVLEKRRGLFLFDKQGKFVRKIGNKGNGPGEYVSPDDITVDKVNKKIYILDSNQRVLKYSSTGAYENSFRLENDATRSNYIQYSENALYTNLYTFDKSRSRFLLSKVNIANGKRTSFQLDASQYNKGWNELFSTDQHTFISVPAGNPKFMQIFMDTIFEITPKGIKPYIAFQSKSLVTKKDMEAQMAQYDMSNPRVISKICDGLAKAKKIYSIYDYWETDKYVHLNYQVGMYGYTALYNKNTNVTSVMTGFSDDLFYTDKAETKLVFKTATFDKDRIYCIGMNDGFTKDILLKNIEKGGISSRIEGADKLKTLTEDSNPIIIYYEFKK